MSGVAALRWGAEDLWLQVEPHAPGFSIEVLPEAASTNTTLVELARAGDTAPCLLVAERQTAGRGRLGRSWQSSQAAPGDSLTFSLGCTLAPPDWSGLSLAVGLALAEALDPAGQHIGIKWPNDLWRRGREGNSDRKLGGILIETVPLPAEAAAHQPNARQVVIGIGLNLAPVQLAPERAALVAAVPPAWLQELEPALTAPQALHRIALPLWQGLQAFEREGFA
ncbi:MAG: biotin--[acetyl-CoA-carboxylase] ligase, partial [Leptothrix sp. (in: b-proteobacteria)]